ncbi:MAG: hypothetical protein AAF485_27915 [Chloroflexota bacterium]
MTSHIDTLWEETLTGEVTTELPDFNIDEGQQVQLEMLSRWESQGEALAGYKIGLTSGRMRNAFGEGLRPFGYILKSRVLNSGDTLSINKVKKMGLENELVFRVAKDVQTDTITAEEAKAVLDGVAPGFEINQYRMRSSSRGASIADNLSQWGIVAGEFIDLEQDFEALVVQLHKNSEVVQETAAKGHIDNHFESVAALIKRLSLFGRGLKAGQLLITGSYTRQAVEEPGSWRGNFGNMGNVHLEVQ